MHRCFPAYYLALSPSEYPPSEVRKKFIKMIIEHQELCHYALLRQQVDSLKQENTMLALKNIALEKDNNGLGRTNKSLQQQIEPLHVQGNVESTQPSEQATTSLSPLYQDQSGIIGLLAHHTQSFFRRRLTKTKSGTLAETENPEANSPRIVSRAQIGNLFHNPE